MELETTRSGDVVIAEACTRVDSTNAREFERTLMRLAGGADRGMVVDCEGLAYISSAGLRAVLLVRKSLKSQGKRFAMCGLGHPIREVFAISGFEKIIPLFGSRDAAVARVSS
ncbi:MAG: STAS domain-containing protein [Bryobacterales bacterium]|nr:STAS domain-containing protein [Bryobacterales bacterium]